MTTARPKPCLRGVLHQYAAPLALGAGVLLVVVAQGGPASVAAAVFVASLVLQFAISAVLHRGRWSPRVETWLRRVDHASIFVLIAGTYTPFAGGLPDGRGHRLLGLVWCGAVLGIGYCLLNVRGPKWGRAALALGLGWTIVPYGGALHAAYGAGILGLIVAGGCLYTLGAIVYATERPMLWPRTFGFHEAFHALTVVAAGLHFVGVFAVVAA